MNEKPISGTECDAVYAEALSFAETVVFEPLEQAVGLMMTRFGMDHAGAAAVMAIVLAKPRPSGDPRFDVCMNGNDLILIIKHSGKRVCVTQQELDCICGDAPWISEEQH